MSLHPLLLRQLRRAFGSEKSAPPSLDALLSQVSAAYEQFDQDRLLTEHVMETSSRELTTANASLLEQNRRNEALLARLRQTINLLHPEAPLSDAQDALDLVGEIARLVAQSKAVEAALREAKEASDSANQAKSDFLANMSHEIRTPLNAVVGMSNMLLDSELPPTERDYIEIIRQNGDALLDIISDILDFSKIEAHHLELEMIPCNLRDLAEQVLDLFSKQAMQSGLDLGVSFAPGTPVSVISDPTRLRQILVNLVGNAMKFTSTGGVGIFVRSQSEGDALRLEFSIEDTGIGIPAERLDRLFKPFSQVDSSNTRKYGGTGLGLAITSRLAELLGGSVSVTSEIGVGSVFRFDILARPCDDADAAPTTNPASLAGRRVLVVDDIAINRRILEQQLTGWGLDVCLAASPGEALQMFAGGRYDLLILDFQMPEMTGARLACELHRLHPGSIPPILILSSRGQQPDEAGSLVARRLTKPVKPTELLAALSTLCAREPGKTAPADTQPVPEAPDSSFAAQHPLRVLVAEDVAVNRKVTNLYLMRLGYHPVSVSNGREALEAVSTNHFDVVLMDMQMPEMDGLTATRMIRRRPGCEHHPYIIALTANVLTEHRTAAAETGMQDYLSKPLQREALIAALRRAHEWITAHPPAASLPGDSAQL